VKPTETPGLAGPVGKVRNLAHAFTFETFPKQ
jgi:hypothetical protein